VAMTVEATMVDDVPAGTATGEAVAGRGMTRCRERDDEDADEENHEGRPFHGALTS
jgi:hypothetical protein